MATNDVNTQGETPQGEAGQTPAGETPQGQQGEQAPAGETPGQEAAKPNEPVTLPDDHPLVKKLAIQKAEIATRSTELTEARAQAAKATKLQEELDKRPTPEALQTLQTRYDRLEAFLQKAGGPLGRALDSRTFTRELFESEKDIDQVVKDWNKANPSATSDALGGGAPAGGGKPNQTPNELIRAAWNGGAK